jgi:hypothetical protein
MKSFTFLGCGIYIFALLAAVGSSGLKKEHYAWNFGIESFAA